MRLFLFLIIGTNTDFNTEFGTCPWARIADNNMDSNTESWLFAYFKCSPIRPSSPGDLLHGRSLMISDISLGYRHTFISYILYITQLGIQFGAVTSCDHIKYFVIVLFPHCGYISTTMCVPYPARQLNFTVCYILYVSPKFPVIFLAQLICKVISNNYIFIIFTHT